jgi:hypothetical protein
VREQSSGDANKRGCDVRRRFVEVVCAVVAGLLVGCNGDGGDSDSGGSSNDPGVSPSIVGTWKLTTTNGQLLADIGAWVTLAVNSDGTGALASNQPELQSRVFMWATSGNHVTLTDEDGGGNVVWPFSRSGNTLTVTAGSDTLVFIVAVPGPGDRDNLLVGTWKRFNNEPDLDCWAFNADGTYVWQSIINRGTPDEHHGKKTGRWRTDGTVLYITGLSLSEDEDRELRIPYTFVDANTFGLPESVERVTYVRVVPR